MEFIPDSSLDDIYLERLHPPPLSGQPKISIFINAARMLKEGGTLVIDFNDGKSPEEHVRRVSALDSLLLKYYIPLSAQVVTTTETNRRNDLSDSSLFVCTKYMEFSPTKRAARDLVLIGLEFENMLSSSNS